MRQAIKKIVFWNYGRTSWQYDALCILILTFIFLTPPSWFNGKERVQLENLAVTRLIVSIDNFSSELDEQSKLRRVRELTGNKNAQIIAWRERRNSDGRTIAYEIDVR